jgi:hypothetical protein
MTYALVTTEVRIRNRADPCSARKCERARADQLARRALDERWIQNIVGDEMKREPFRELRERELVFHGLRKPAVVFLLEAGCTDAEVSAITGQSRQMVEHHARQVNQKKLAAAAVLK